MKLPINLSRRSIAVILLGALLFSLGRLAEYTAWAAKPLPKKTGLKIVGVDVIGCDFLPPDVVRKNVEASGLRPGSVIKGNVVITPNGKKIPLPKALRLAKIYAKLSVIPGTKIKPIRKVHIKIKKSGIVVVRVVEDYGLPRKIPDMSAVHIEVARP